MQNILIGREDERQTLQKAFDSGAPEMVAVFGRRRVGKTFLVKQTYGAHITFELTGLQASDNAGQLQNFSIQLAKFSQSPVPLKVPGNWLEAFFMLSNYLDQLPRERRQVVFLDELPWLAGHKSGFLMGLSWFWNSWAEQRNVVVVICGSAASWMIQKVVNDRGGLHNRITKRVFLQPFTLGETEAYFQSRNLPADRYPLLQLYMALGGIPHYLKEIEPGKSAAQNVNDICFSPGGLLRDEFSRLYPALFANSDNHVAVVRALAQVQQGLSRQDIVKIGQLPEGGNTSRVLEELEQSSFISSYYPFGKVKKDMLYRLTDEYSLFYLRFIERHKSDDRETWNLLSQTQSAKTWWGYAFENACLRHVPQIKKALGIAGVYTEQSTWRYVPKDPGERGAQIDLLLDRADKVINLVEIKFANDVFTIDKAYAEALRSKRHLFMEKTGTRKAVFLTMLTTFGVEKNQHYLSQVQNEITMDGLFKRR